MLNFTPKDWRHVQGIYTNNIRRIYMPLHSKSLFWFRANQSLLLLLKASWFADSSKYQFNNLWFDPTIYHTWGMHVNHFITVVVFESRISYNSIDLYQNEKLSRIIYLYYFFYCTCLNIDVKFLNNNNMCDTTWIIQLNNQLLQQIV